MIQQKQKNSFFDSDLIAEEQLPRIFSISFKEISDDEIPKVLVCSTTNQLGDIVDDNSYENDFYRYHDIFHYSFATMLGWSPCARAMMRRKRKSNEIIDRIEDGARATITEEAISLIIFNEAKRKNFFTKGQKINKTTIKIIKGMTDCFEVRERTEAEWRSAIDKSYSIFRKLISNKGGTVHFDMNSQTIKYSN